MIHINGCRKCITLSHFLQRIQPFLVVNSSLTSHESIVELNETENLSGLDESKGDRPVAQTHCSVRNDECLSVDSDASSIVSSEVGVEAGDYTPTHRLSSRSRNVSKTVGVLPKKLIEDSFFDPLEEEVIESESDLEMDDGSGDDSLPGHNEEWLNSSKKMRKGDTLSSSIDVNHPIPRLVYEDIPVLFQGPEEAENVRRYFVVERRSEPMPGNDSTRIGDTPGIEGFEVWRRGEYGCGLRSTLDRCPHYDTNRGGYNRLLRRAKQRNIPFLHVPKGTTTIVNGMHKLFLSNEDQFQEEISDLDIEGIFRDSMIKEHPTDSTKM